MKQLTTQAYFVSVGACTIYPEDFHGKKSIVLLNDYTGWFQYARWVCVGLNADEKIPGGFAVRPGDWDSYVSGVSGPYVPHDDVSFYELYWGLATEMKMAILQDWMTGEFGAGSLVSFPYLGGTTLLVDGPILMAAGGNNVTIQNKFWTTLPATDDYQPAGPVTGMVPLLAERGSPVIGGGVDLESVVQALRDIAQKTTVWQLNNRGAIADLSSGDIVTPGGTDEPE